MRFALLTAGTAPSLPNRGDLYEIVSVIDSTTLGTPPRNLRKRRQFDDDLAEQLYSMSPDYVIAAGYPYILTEPVLEAFPDRIIVMHNGDLTDRDESGRRRWVGLRPVLDALLAGATSTRTSLYFATRDIGDGPLLLVGPRHAVPEMVQASLAQGYYDAVATYALLHSRWMRRSWGDLLLRAIEILAAGSMKIAGEIVWIDGVPGPCRLGEAPDLCHQSEGRIRRGIPASCPFIQ